MSRMNVKEETNSSQQGKIDVKITFDESMLQLRQTPFGTIIDMDECITTGNPATSIKNTPDCNSATDNT
jgi:hypothetical protein